MTDEGSIDAVYRERSKCVFLITRMAAKLGYDVGVGKDLDEPEWPVIFVHLPSGQVSWHVSREDYDRYFKGLPVFPHPYDGHDTEEKYRRVLHPEI